MVREVKFGTKILPVYSPPRIKVNPKNASTGLRAV